MAINIEDLAKRISKENFTKILHAIGIDIILGRIENRNGCVGASPVFKEV